LRFDKGVVYKSAPVDKSIRLLKQAEKQRWFSEQKIGLIGVPKVFSTYEGGFSMELVPGKPLLEIVEELSDEDLLIIVNSLQSFLEYCRDNAKYSATGLTMSTAKKIGKSYELESFIKSPCHGDLTLENMVYDKEKKRLYLLDFLDSYHDHYFLDIIAVLQNTVLRFHDQSEIPPEEYYQTKLWRLHQLFTRMVQYTFPEALAFTNYLLLAKMMRIRPYVDDERKGLLEELIALLEDLTYGHHTAVVRDEQQVQDEEA
jgi:tRNA A-37 threonylcarbamoyl transferase component Bud32